MEEKIYYKRKKFREKVQALMRKKEEKEIMERSEEEKREKKTLRGFYYIKKPCEGFFYVVVQLHAISEDSFLLKWEALMEMHLEDCK